MLTNSIIDEEEVRGEHNDHLDLMKNLDKDIEYL